MTLGATLYVKDSLEAAAFYCDAFNMTIGYNAKHDDGTYLTHPEGQTPRYTLLAK